MPTGCCCSVPRTRSRSTSPLGRLPFEERAAQRSSSYAFDEEGELRTCSAENLIVMKVFAGRDADWADVTGVVTRCGPRLDVELLREELLPLLEAIGAPGRAGRLWALLEEAGR